MIPTEIRERLGLQPGDRFEIEVRDGELMLTPLKRSALLALRGAFKGPNRLTDALLEDRQAERRAQRY